MPTQSFATSRPENGNKKQLNSMLENLSEEALAQLREFAESLQQQEKSSVENPVDISQQLISLSS